ncbi:hypothetical protein BN2497_555 [Janthinobacterium sp. CG23_2]|nr:hypothetical protein BN2497_555 [Janthinobacterium sp. CG23_2]CUU26675.1 hypothetical protein BN3177_555 [Janthinobacterium sp. CG23_2]
MEERGVSVDHSSINRWAIGMIRGMDNFLRLRAANKRCAGGLLLHGLAIVDGRGSGTATNALSLVKLGKRKQGLQLGRQ